MEKIEKKIDLLTDMYLEERRYRQMQNNEHRRQLPKVNNNNTDHLLPPTITPRRSGKLINRSSSLRSTIDNNTIMITDRPSIDDVDLYETTTSTSPVYTPHPLVEISTPESDIDDEYDDGDDDGGGGTTEETTTDRMHSPASSSKTNDYIGIDMLAVDDGEQSFETSEKDDDDDDDNNGKKYRFDV